MREREEITEPVTRQETRVVRDIATCDICGRAANYPGSYHLGAEEHVNWTEERPGGYTEFLVTAVTRITGYYDSDEHTGSGQRECFHVCPTCWDKVAAFIGAELTVTEWEW